MKIKRQVCSECGDAFTRRWNLQRHIARLHQGNKVSYSEQAKSQYESGNIAGSPLKTNSVVSSTEYIVSRHVQETLRRKIPNLQEAFGYRGYVCDNCLTIDVFPVRPRYLSFGHVCDSLWLIDHPRLLNHKNLIKQYLDNQLPVFLAKAFVEQRYGGKIELVAGQVDKSHTHDPKEFMLELPSYKENFPDYPAAKAVIDFLNKKFEIEDQNDPSRDWLKPIELGLPPESHWAKRAIRERTTKLELNELTDFLRSANNKTGAIFKISNPGHATFYFMRLIILD